MLNAARVTAKGSNDTPRLVSAAKSAGKLLMVAHVLPFFPEFRFATEAIRGGQYGKVLGAHFKRVISKPDWSSDIGDAAVFLLAPASAYMHGAVVPVDGGWLAR